MIFADGKFINVLLVDDDEEDYILTKYVFDDLRSSNYRLEWVNNFNDALDSMKQSRHDIYLVDYHLGGKTGLDLLREAIQAGCTSPVILLTGQGDSDIDLEAMKAGASDYLVKGELEAPVLERAMRYSIKHARSLEELQNSEKRFRSVIQSASDAIFVVDKEGEITLWNKAAADIFGYSEDEIINFPATSLMGAKYAKKALEYGLQKTLEEIIAPMSGLTINASGRRKDGSEFPLELSGSIWKTNEGIYYTAIIRDVTERRRAEERLFHEATHDALTGLPNRTQFRTFLQEAIDHARLKRTKFAVLFLDLDRFKVINDGLGHVVGDKLLVSIGERLRACVRPGDIVSRFGGDEFTILLKDIPNPSIVTEIAERLQRDLTSPFKIDGYEVFSSASIGIILSDENHTNPESFLRDADTAMYRAKETGKARYEIFDNAMHVRNVNLLQMENDLRRAIDRKEFVIFYQPIIDLQTKRILEFEALLRWNHPERGMVPPNDFIPVAEETGLIVPIGEWTMGEACRQIAEWHETFPLFKELCVSVNLSIKQLVNASLTNTVKDILKTTNLDPRYLKLEVTESMVMENADLALNILSELCALGVLISTDDFGTGYSSLSYLHHFPFERLKIDRSFVGRMDTEEKSEEIVRTILTLAENLHLEVVAEGIENERQFEQLRKLGCHFGQGYLFSKPVPAQAAERILLNGLDGVLSAPLAQTFELPKTPVMEVREIQ
ncbi:MAG TPA: EAL domain-containing protein [Pyrinomonadaceae bacterium]|nr:EAL domain-containing protein [Pyrinomonadaceae bacterium]